MSTIVSVLRNCLLAIDKAGAIAELYQECKKPICGINMNCLTDLIFGEFLENSWKSVCNDCRAERDKYIPWPSEIVDYFNT